MAAGQTREQVYDSRTFQAWHANFNDGDATFETRLKDYEYGIKRALKRQIQNESFFMISDFKSSLSSSLTPTEQDRRIQAYKRFLMQAVEEPTEKSLNEFTTGYFTFESNELSLSKEAQFLEILDGTYVSGADTKLEKIFDNFFGKFLNRNNDEWFDSSFDKDLEDDVEKEIAKGNLRAAERASEGFGTAEDEDQKIEETNANIQCALMSLIYQREYHGKNKFKALENALARRTRFRNRILQLDHGSRAHLLNNFFISDDGFKTLMQNPAALNGFEKKLYYVYEKKIKDNNGNISFETFEVPLAISSVNLDDDTTKKMSAIEGQLFSNKTPGGIGLNANQKKALELQLERLKRDNDPSKKGETALDYFSLDKINIKYDGTNPSTARNDVEVTISFTLESFAALNRQITSDPIAFEEVNKKTTKEGHLKLRDLVIQGIDSDGKSGSLNALKNSYSPFTNRIRLKVVPQTINYKLANSTKTVPTGNPLILDLTTIDHTISRNSSDGSVSFTINYRGYFHSILTMPFCDVLADNDTRFSRKARHDNINKILLSTKECKPETLREILRIERNSFELENNDDRFNEILTYIMKGNKTAVGIWEAEFDLANTSFDSAVRNLPKAGKDKFITSIGAVGLGNLTTEVQNAIKAATAEEGQTNFLGQSSGTATSFKQTKGKSYFTFFGDIIHAAIKNLYQTGSDEDKTREEFGDFNLKFLMSPIHIPDPINGKNIKVYPVDIPVDIFFFAEWWNEVVIKKDLKIYPAGAFIRDFVERCLNNILFETCLSHLLPDEKPPMLRCQYFTSKYKLTANTTEGRCDVSLKNCAVGIGRALPRPYFVEDVNLSSTAPQRLSTNNYLVIYQQAPVFSRALSAKRNRTMKEEKSVATITAGINAKKFTQVKQVSFSKTTSPYLREARYFNNNFGGMALMNNVYDLSFSFNRHHANTYLFPGTIINFILADFSPVSTKLDYFATAQTNFNTLKLVRSVGSAVTPTNYQYTNNDPHNHLVIGTDQYPTDAYMLGFGGYFMVKSVEYELEPIPGLFTVKVTCKFLGTDYDTSVKRDSAIESIEADDTVCIQYYNNARKENEALANLEGEVSDFAVAVQNTQPNQPASVAAGVETTGVGTATSPTAVRTNISVPSSVTSTTTGGSSGTSTVPALAATAWQTQHKTALKGRFEKEFKGKKVYYYDGTDYFGVPFKRGVPNINTTAVSGRPSGNDVVILDASANVKE